MSSSDPHPLALPQTFSPDDIDPLTELSIILTKLRANIQNQPSQSSSTTQQQQQQQQHQPQQPSAADAQSQTTQPQPSQQPDDNAAAPSSSQLSFKDVPNATDTLKHKLQRARAQVASLPDMQRSLAEQRDEVARLEGRIAMQRALLERLKGQGVRFGKEEAAVGTASAAAVGEEEGGGDKMEM